MDWSGVLLREEDEDGREKEDRREREREREQERHIKKARGRMKSQFHEVGSYYALGI